MNIGSSNDEAAVKAQYANSNSLSTRINFHELYSTNKQGYGNWIMSNYEIPEGAKVLELGCGTGASWIGHDDLIAKCDKLLLTDFSEGMLETCKKNVGERDNVEYMQADIQDLPFEDNSFDIVIANAMLYHIPDLDKGVREVRRVLKDGGTFYASTYGENGFSEELAKWFDLGGEAFMPNHNFTLVNGKDILGKQFSDVQVLFYKDSFHITNVEDLADYLQSLKALHGIGSLSREKTIEVLLTHEVNGAIDLPKDYGMFIAR
ncbi:class I SAM-dependent methyltransferase [Butyrivibrio sp. VCB2006]|uniref:class I SAM-dependent methyltransferase n=1 Tax=Butyrivibrio sp. VCB2006 TaxID=1280679 RepID=UPI0003FE660E|nr:class I SAM-dependent methyltransferase [Butyrivibrio sp. VCB2006]